MLKIAWGRDEAGLPAHLSYISGTGRYRHKKKAESITCDPQIATKLSQESFLSEYAMTLAPDTSKGQRAGKRNSLRIILSWLGDMEQQQYAFLDDFMAENFPNCLWSWARHGKKPNRLGQQTSHFHIVVCPRRQSDGKMIDVRKGDLNRLKNSYLKLSKQLGLSTGWDREPQTRVKEMPVHRKRRERKSVRSRRRNRRSHY